MAITCHRDVGTAHETSRKYLNSLQLVSVTLTLRREPMALTPIRITALRHSAFYSPLLYTINSGLLQSQGLEPHYTPSTPSNPAVEQAEGRSHRERSEHFSGNSHCFRSIILVRCTGEEWHRPPITARCLHCSQSRLFSCSDSVISRSDDNKYNNRLGRKDSKIEALQSNQNSVQKVQEVHIAI